MTTDGVGTMVEAMPHDRSYGVRRNAAGQLMWGQHDNAETVTSAFRDILDRDTDSELRKRAAWALARNEVPRGNRPLKEWIPDWLARVKELAAAGPSR